MISAQGIYFSYTGAAPFVLRGVDFEIRDGEYVSVVGENGSGKSTLIRLILGLLKPLRGSVETHAGHTGYVPQRGSADAAGFPITVYEMLNSYRRLLKIRDRGVIERSLELVNISEHRNVLTRELSGGQSQKTMIARALIGEPELIVLDEPSTGIDTRSQHDIYELLKRLNKENGITIVSVEHNLTAAVSNSTLIYHLSGGLGHICTPEQYAAEYLHLKRPGGGADA